MASCAAPPAVRLRRTEAISTKPYGSLTVGWSTQTTGNLLDGGNMFGGLGSTIYDTLIKSKLTSTGNTRIPELDELVDKLPFIRDPAEKKKVALQAAVLAQSNYAIPAFLEVQTLFAIGPKVGEFKPIKGRVTYLGPIYATIAHAQ